jgi:hypothetical protein
MVPFVQWLVRRGKKNLCWTDSQHPKEKYYDVAAGVDPKATPTHLRVLQVQRQHAHSRLRGWAMPEQVATDLP